MKFNKQYTFIYSINSAYSMHVKGKAVPLQAWSGPEGFRKLSPLKYTQINHVFRMRRFTDNLPNLKLFQKFMFCWPCILLQSCK